uniref:SDR family NAD(P)-dependent oxidoreductase n=1 Tax=Pedobacter sp. TaxID=1411316 RepID=UPI003D7F2C86
MDLQLKEKVIIITGAAKGIGQAIAEVLSIEGAIAVIIGRREADNLKVVAAIEAHGGKAFQVVAELAIPESCADAVKAVIEKYGRIDGLVNNAGVNDGVGLEHGNYKDFMASLHKNVVHYYLMAHYALPELIKSKGVIVNITSKTA